MLLEKTGHIKNDGNKKRSSFETRSNATTFLNRNYTRKYLLVQTNYYSESISGV